MTALRYVLLTLLVIFPLQGLSEKHSPGQMGMGGGMGMHEGQGMQGGMMNMPMMKQHMSQMREHMQKMSNAKSDRERNREMMQHMEMMQEHMEMMTHMMEMMHGEDAGMNMEGDTRMHGGMKGKSDK